MSESWECFAASEGHAPSPDPYVINPILRGWVKHFRVGHSSRCFGYIKDWVENKVRRHLVGARNLGGFGWGRWSRAWVCQTLGYMVTTGSGISGLESAASPIGHINLRVKLAGKRYARKGHVPFDVAGDGNQIWVGY